MVPKFTTECLVHIVDISKRKEVCSILESKGYRICPCSLFKQHTMLYTSSIERGTRLILEVHGATIEEKVQLPEAIDCFGNIDIFLILTKMRNSIDKGQWFIERRKYYTDRWVLCSCNKALESTPSRKITKATAQEIIKHFKTK